MEAELEQQIDQKAREIRTDGYSMSIGEVISLCIEGDIDIHPEFQRIFRWKGAQKSRLIESILLGIPIPPVFVSQRQDGVWDVIDGVQRLSTVLEFTGNYIDEHGNKLPGFQLESGEYLTEMDGFRWGLSAEVRQQDGVYGDSGKETPESFGDPSKERVFGPVLQRDFKRAKLEFRIITKGSDSSAKYDLFQRLNSGSVLSPQEARNCLMVMMNRDMFALIKGLSSEQPFRSSLQLSERQEDQAYAEELVLRFFAQEHFAGGDTELREEYGEYLTNWMREIALGDGISEAETELFKETFSVLVRALGEDVFRRWDGSRHTGPFSISGYEFISSGVAANIEHWRDSGPDELCERIRNAWTDETFRGSSGTGVSPRRRVPRLINRSREYFA